MVNEFLPFLMNELNCMDISSLTNRIILQKKIYLLQKFGFDLGYDYKWYWYGPYSVLLNKDYYNIDKMDNTNVLLNKSQEDALYKLSELLKGNEDSLKFVEMAASLIFIKEENPFWNNEEIMTKLLNEKSHLDSEGIKKVVEKLKNFSLI